VVLSELTRPLELGDTVIVTLVLEKTGGLGVIATVE
jgi:copper(I)-binding protein